MYRQFTYVVLIGVSLWAMGCVKELGNDAPALGQVDHDCVVPLPEGVETWGAPVSIEYPDGSLWIWESVTLTGGETRHNVAAFVKSVDAVCNGELSLITDVGGLPVSLVELDEAEMQWNTNRTDGRRVELHDARGRDDRNERIPSCVGISSPIKWSINIELIALV